jgi:hypothetical protein
MLVADRPEAFSPMTEFLLATGPLFLLGSQRFRSSLKNTCSQLLTKRDEETSY